MTRSWYSEFAYDGTFDTIPSLEILLPQQFDYHQKIIWKIKLFEYLLSRALLVFLEDENIHHPVLFHVFCKSCQFVFVINFFSLVLVGGSLSDCLLFLGIVKVDVLELVTIVFRGVDMGEAVRAEC